MGVVSTHTSLSMLRLGRWRGERGRVGEGVGEVPKPELLVWSTAPPPTSAEDLEKEIAHCHLTEVC